MSNFRYHDHLLHPIHRELEVTLQEVFDADSFHLSHNKVHYLKGSIAVKALGYAAMILHLHGTRRNLHPIKVIH